MTCLLLGMCRYGLITPCNLNELCPNYALLTAVRWGLGKHSIVNTNPVGIRKVGRQASPLPFHISILTGYLNNR